MSQCSEVGRVVAGTSKLAQPVIVLVRQTLRLLLNPQNSGMKEAAPKSCQDFHTHAPPHT